MPQHLVNGPGPLCSKRIAQLHDLVWRGGVTCPHSRQGGLVARVVRDELAVRRVLVNVLRNGWVSISWYGCWNRNDKGKGYQEGEREKRHTRFVSCLG